MNIPQHQSDGISDVIEGPELSGPTKPALISIAHFCRWAAVGRTTAFTLIREGQLDVCRIRRRTLVVRASAEALIERSLVKARS